MSATTRDRRIYLEKHNRSGGSTDYKFGTIVERPHPQGGIWIKYELLLRPRDEAMLLAAVQRVANNTTHPGSSWPYIQNTELKTGEVAIKAAVRAGEIDFVVEAILPDHMGEELKRQRKESVIEASQRVETLLSSHLLGHSEPHVKSVELVA